jgi:hypothetical protein
MIKHHEGKKHQRGKHQGGTLENTVEETLGNIRYEKRDFKYR